MGGIRINELARELEVKSRAVLDCLKELGFTDKRSHSSSVDDETADKVRAYFSGQGEAQKSGGEKPKATASAEKETPAPTSETAAELTSSEPAKHPEAEPARQSFRRSIAEIKAAAQDNNPAASPSSPREPSTGICCTQSGQSWHRFSSGGDR